MEWFLIVLFSFLAGLIQALTGFGAAAVLMIFLPYYYGMQVSPTITHIICISLCTVMLWRYRKHLSRSILLPTAVFTVFNLLAIQLVKGIDLTALTIAFGVFLILLALYFLLFANRLKLKGSTQMTLGVSAVSGILGGLFGVGGPSIATYLVTVTESTQTYIANLQFLFFVTNSFSVASRIMNGMFSMNYVPLCLAGMAAILAGEFLGERIGSKLDRNVTKKLVYIFVGISGILTILQKVIW